VSYAAEDVKAKINGKGVKLPDFLIVEGYQSSRANSYIER
jgi:hypothetical protein